MKNLIYLFVIIIAFSACREKVDIDLNFAGQKLVVEGRVTTEQDSSQVMLSLTAPYNSTQVPPPVTNAVVEVSKDNGPAIVFSHVGNGVYKPAAGFTGEKDHNYKLRIVYDGKEYTSESYLYPMFEVVDTLVQKFEPKQGFVDEGYSITYWSNDSRTPVKYTWFNFGKNDTLEDFDVLFDNSNLIRNSWQPFELPFFRGQKGDSVMVIFRSIDVYVNNYLLALGNLSSGAPGPFQTPPANPPTNLKGGALGFFYSADVVRRWRIIN